MKIKGIYGIFDLDGECLYIGQSYHDLNKRLSTHKSNIKYGKHQKEELNELGLDNIEIKILETYDDISRLELKKRESYYMRTLKPLLNKNRAGIASSDVNPKESHIKRSNAQSGHKNPNSKLSESDVIGIKKLLAEKKKLRIISEIYGVSIQQISRIKNGQEWADKKVELPLVQIEVIPQENVLYDGIISHDDIENTLV